MNIPNLLTVIRFFLIPLYLYFFLSPIQNSVEIAIGVFVLSGITDTLDGYIARKYNQVTRIGKILDPLADKLMLITVLVSITLTNAIPIWIIGVVVFKELLMIFGAISLFSEDRVVVSANVFGKISTLLSYIAILAVLFELPFDTLILYIYVATTILALISYVNKFINIKKRNRLELIKNRVDKYS